MTKHTPAWASTSRSYRTKSETELREEGFFLNAMGQLQHAEGMVVNREGLGITVHYAKEGYVSDDGYFVDLENAIWLVVKEYLH